MKTVQIQLSDEIHETLKAMSRSKRMALDDVVKEALQVYVIAIWYSMQGKTLMFEDPKDGNRVEVIIPALRPKKKGARRP